jgi:hypothetical protein
VALVGGALMIRRLNPQGVRIVASIPLSDRLRKTTAATYQAELNADSPEK